MAPKTPMDDTAKYLFLCLQHSNYTKIDFEAIGNKLGIKKHTAYCRLDNYKKQYKDDPLLGKSDAGPSSAAASPAPNNKRKRAPKGDDEDDGKMNGNKRGRKTTKKTTNAAGSRKKSESVDIFGKAEAEDDSDAEGGAVKEADDEDEEEVVKAERVDSDDEEGADYV
ncbi:hypothetical protein K402DRAFT_460206 [Aulographum hederae CBS 113979]|uniref:Myb-like DNA-binding domain-containing protein n=1 Tax=Aulographum hederae CBS 113979 TaxID=1176131 RepID=A0A6G1HCK2_9PEZI|nr:hypothetical protein K402DRAFT_460206 [Aulographum hederae CBS 113979]